MKPIRPPAKNPCGSCPYRRDVPSGVWDAAEYEKLLDYDLPTAEQPPAIFLCHQQDGRACAGWVATHDMNECLGLRVAAATGAVQLPDSFLDYGTTVALFGSGAEAAEHGLRDIADPDADARRVIDKLTARLGAKWTA